MNEKNKAELFEHYTHGDENNKFIDGAFKRIIEASISGAAHMMPDWSIENVKEPSLKNLIELYKKELIPTFRNDERVQALFDNTLFITFFLLNKDAYYRDRFLFFLKRIQDTKPILDSSLKENVGRDIERYYMEVNL